MPPRGSWRQFSGWGVSQETPGKRASLLGGSEVGGCCGGHGGRQEEGALLSETWKKALHALVWTPSLHSGSTSSLLRKGCLLTLCLQSGTVLCFIPLVPSKSLRFRIWVSLRVSFSFFFFFLVPLPFDSQFPIHKALYTIHGKLRGHRLRKRL